LIRIAYQDHLLKEKHNLFRISLEKQPYEYDGNSKPTTAFYSRVEKWKTASEQVTLLLRQQLE
jgi:hypothetical protein